MVLRSQDHATAAYKSQLFAQALQLMSRIVIAEMSPTPQQSRGNGTVAALALTTTLIETLSLIKLLAPQMLSAPLTSAACQSPSSIVKCPPLPAPTPPRDKDASAPTPPTLSLRELSSSVDATEMIMESVETSSSLLIPVSAMPTEALALAASLRPLCRHRSPVRLALLRAPTLLPSSATAEP